MKYKIAVLTPKSKNDYLTDTVIDGLLSLKKENSELEFYIPSTYKTDLDKTDITLEKSDFVDFAKKADLVLFMRGKDNIKRDFLFFTMVENNTDYETINKIDKFSKTVFIDGTELGGDKRYDKKIRDELIDGSFVGRGAIERNMEEKCALYFRRERPYLRDIIPFPFGIENAYRKYYSQEKTKDIDFFCVFGGGDYAPLRKEVTEHLVHFCQKNNFKYFTEKTDVDNFYRMLARSKVGISVGGGGFDTARFWEILGNNCMLFTEKIDIYEDDSNRLKYDRIWQFENIEDFKEKIEDLGRYIRADYKQENLTSEYESILASHSSKARVLEIIQKAKEKGIIE